MQVFFFSGEESQFFKECEISFVNKKHFVMNGRPLNCFTFPEGQAPETPGVSTV